MRETPWRAPTPLGYLESIQAVGGFAAPLLAGASFTLAVLALQSSAGPPVSRWPDVALAFFVAAGLAQIGTVQATAWTRRYTATPGDLAAWYPGELTDGAPTPWLRNVQESHLRQALRWANAARLSFHLGIVALLGGVVFACVPPGTITPARWAVLAVAVLGLVAELFWLVRTAFLAVRLRRRAYASLALLLAVTLGGLAGAPWPVRLVAAAALLACLFLRRSWLPAASLAAGAVALVAGWWEIVAYLLLTPAAVVAVRDLIGLWREQRGRSAG
ncbi:hypothetical protein [Herbidospora daliensis]|uniref:hypothetical protein n=1 Tax=Herbidospora daliensis TaxID=295585 RepID=UPI0007811686|nr:hypothetical protein [Herbidospora daliensis]